MHKRKKTVENRNVLKWKYVFEDKLHIWMIIDSLQYTMSINIIAFIVLSI
jgi:hypothetical protein